MVVFSRCGTGANVAAKDGSKDFPAGVRPVISLNEVNLKLEGHVWKVVN